MHSRALAWATALMSVLLGGCRPAAQKAPLPNSAPQRIVSLAPSATEMLFAAGAGPRVVATDDFSDYPPEAKILPHVGGLTVNVEAVLAARPDLVVGVRDLQGASLSRLGRMGLRTLALDTTSYQKTIDAIRLVGREIGDSRKADAAARRLEQARKEARAAAPARAPLVLFVAQAEPSVFAAGQETFPDDLLRLAGARNATPAKGFAVLSQEALIAMKPDLVLVGSSDEAAAMRRRMPSARVAIMPRDILVRPGPRLGDGLMWLSGHLGAAR